MPHDMIDEYFEIYKKSVKQYGEKTCVFYACGSFYEVYKVENKNETIGNADVIAEIIRCDFSNKNKSKRSEEGSSRAFPDFCGFGIPYLPKYLTPLLENNYTVVIVDQLESSSERKGKLVKRGVVAVHSPCLKSPDLETYNDTDINLVSITVEIIESRSQSRKDVLLYSVASVNNITNKIEISENVQEFHPSEFRLCLDDMNKILTRYNIRELRCFYLCDTEQETHENQFYLKTLTKYLDEQASYNSYIYKNECIYKDTQLYKDYSKTLFKNEYFRRIYKHIDFGLIDPLEYLNLHDKDVSALNFMLILDFIAKHDLKYIQNLQLPSIIKETSNLILELNTLNQLNLLPNRSITNNKITSVFDVIDNTSTSIGRRHLKSLLTKPFRNKETIQFRYNLSKSLGSLGENEKCNLDKMLSTIIDFDRLHRKMGLEALHPYEFEKLDTSYTRILNLFDFVKQDYTLSKLIPDENILEKFVEYITDYKHTFNLAEMKRVGFNTTREDFVSFFNTSVVSDLDKIQTDIEIIEGDVEKLRITFEDIINEKSKTTTSTKKTETSTNQMIKLGFTENDGYFFTCTKIRYQKLIKECKDTNFNTRQTSNMCKFSTETLVSLSNRLINTRELLVKRVKFHYIKKLQEYYYKYNNVFTSLSSFIETLDVCFSNIKCARKYKYSEPVILDNKYSCLRAEKMRHPIIELVNNDTEYVPNDVVLDNNTLGMLVYGLNSSGKSSLLRSVGVCIVLAQCGLYVPCKSFEFVPFDTLISQVDLTDNLFANKSSFTSEMCGLKRILTCSGPNTLVLSDELCRGTEVISSSAIVGTTLLHLVKTQSKFFFTTHLHNLVQIDSISKQKCINVCHLRVETRDDSSIVFERTLAPGSGSELYGLEVCRSIIQNSEFIDTAFNIRNDIISNKTQVIDTGRSRYNKKKIVDSCQVCGHKPKRGEIPLDTHHINEQKDCDDLGFVNDKHFHKNKLHNLVSLCKTCHRKIDTQELIIRGYKSSTSGIFLDYSMVSNSAISNSADSK
jgi:DNA mismatch repair protein MutS